MSNGMSSTPVSAVGHTNVGQRKHNEDAFLVNQQAGLMIVADGVGGHNAGEVASDITCKALEREVCNGASLEAGIAVANSEVYMAVAQQLGRANMASTVVAVHFSGQVWDLAWVGDSRAYLWDGQLGLLSRDHSLVESLVSSGRISLEEARSHPQKNVIEQAVGLQMEDNLHVGCNRGVLQPGQTLLLCSDGLNDVLDSARISAILAAGGTLDERCQELVMAAVNKGGRDNTTVVLIEPDEAAIVVEGAPVPHFVWRYNPSDDSYSGLPELQPRPKANVTKVAPRAPEDGTVIMQPPLTPQGVLGEADRQGQADTKRRSLWIGVAIVVLVLAVAGIVIYGM
jgi:PPM family protein phosphatase